MTLIVNKSMTEGKVPFHFKKALIKPLYKKGPANQCRNYRPVSLLPSLSKIFRKSNMLTLNALPREKSNTMHKSIWFQTKESNHTCCT